jgi:hypothetical protein
LRAGWFDPSLKGRVQFPQWRQLLEYFKAILRTPVSPMVKIKCMFWLGVDYRHRIGRLTRELLVGLRQRFTMLRNPMNKQVRATEVHG